jgi:hypothetical protein
MAALIASGPIGGVAQTPAPVAAPAVVSPVTTLLGARFERRVEGMPVADSAGVPYAFPWLGGLDRPRPQLADLDGDGDLDLFVQERPGRMMFFERVAAANGRPARWVWRTDWWQGIDVGEWSRLVDVDGDGDLDLVAESPYSFIRWWRNDGGKQAAKLTMATDTVKDAQGQPIYADRQNIPQLADLDCDGKLDLMLGRVDGTIVRYELEGIDPNTGPRFALVTDRFEGLQILTGEAAPGGLPATPDAAQPNPNPNLSGSQGPSLHGANTMALVDVDHDGDQDILWGDFFEPGLLWLRNSGSCAAPAMREPQIEFPVGAPLRTSGYNAPAAADLDGDGDLDLVVGVLGGAYNPTRTSTDNLYLLEQTAPGTFARRTTRLLDGIDVGSDANPALVDLDGDGDLDLVVGNRLEPDRAGTAGLYVFRNVGTTKAPAFRAEGRLAVEAGYQFAPAFGDLDGDGDPDLVLGTFRDALVYYRNDGAKGAPRFVLADTALVRLTRGSHASPVLADVDGDGDLDLLAGEASGTVNYWRNDGTRTSPKSASPTSASPQFTLVSDELDGIHAGRRSVPRLVDLDGDGDLDLVVGNEAGRPLVFRNTGTRRAPAFVPDSTAAVDWPLTSAPTFADLDGDGRVDALVGTASGGVVRMAGRK